MMIIDDKRWTPAEIELFKIADAKAACGETLTDAEFEIMDAIYSDLERIQREDGMSDEELGELLTHEV